MSPKKTSGSLRRYLRVFVSMCAFTVPTTSVGLVCSD